MVSRGLKSNLQFGELNGYMYNSTLHKCNVEEPWVKFQHDNLLETRWEVQYAFDSSGPLRFFQY